MCIYVAINIFSPRSQSWPSVVVNGQLLMLVFIHVYRVQIFLHTHVFYDLLTTIVVIHSCCYWKSSIVKFQLFSKMMFSVPHFFIGVNPRKHPVAIALSPCFDSRYALSDAITMRYVRGTHPPDDISLFALECDDFLTRMCALDSKSETQKYDHSSARKRFMHICKVLSKCLEEAFCYKRQLALLFSLFGRMKSLSLSLVDTKLNKDGSRFGGASFVCSAASATFLTWFRAKCTCDFRCGRFPKRFERFKTRLAMAGFHRASCSCSTWIPSPVPYKRVEIFFVHVHFSSVPLGSTTAELCCYLNVHMTCSFTTSIHLVPGWPAP